MTYLDLRPATDEVEDQAGENSCTGNAIVSACEVTDEIAGKPRTDYSRNFNYWNSRALLGWMGDVGSTGEAAVRAGAQFGMCQESIWPYTSATVNSKPSDAAYMDAATRRIVRWESLAALDPATVKSRLDERMPVVFAFPVAQEFFGISGTFAEQWQSYVKDGMPFVSYGHARVGYHEVLAIGYDDARECYLVQNSWGPGWGDGGFYLYPYQAMAREALGGIVIREFNGTSIVSPVAPDLFEQQLTTYIVGTFGRGPFDGEIDAWRNLYNQGVTMNTIRWSLTCSVEFKARLLLYAPSLYHQVYGDLTPDQAGPIPAPRGPGDY